MIGSTIGSTDYMQTEVGGIFIAEAQTLDDGVVLLILVHETWSQWSPFSDCDVKCGAGKSRRVRTCVSRSADATACPGEATDEKDCKKKDCVGWLLCHFAIFLPSIEVIALNREVRLG